MTPSNDLIKSVTNVLYESINETLIKSHGRALLNFFKDEFPNFRSEVIFSRESQRWNKETAYIAKSGITSAQLEDLFGISYVLVAGEDLTKYGLKLNGEEFIGYKDKTAKESMKLIHKYIDPKIIKGSEFYAFTITNSARLKDRLYSQKKITPKVAVGLFSQTGDIKHPILTRIDKLKNQGLKLNIQAFMDNQSSRDINAVAKKMDLLLDLFDGKSESVARKNFGGSGGYFLNYVDSLASEGYLVLIKGNLKSNLNSELFLTKEVEQVFKSYQIKSLKGNEFKQEYPVYVAKGGQAKVAYGSNRLDKQYLDYGVSIDDKIDQIKREFDQSEIALSVKNSLHRKVSIKKIDKKFVERRREGDSEKVEDIEVWNITIVFEIGKNLREYTDLISSVAKVLLS